ncbi:Uncharacterised protein [Mycobacteroides abscessus subsp. abscessus]|nr:Uncharacterised protein [Mycobacteroides abscessus subsp. abscessus]
MLIPQLPPDSHAAMASQLTGSALAVPASAIGAATSAGAMAHRTARVVSVLRMYFMSFLSPGTHRPHPLADTAAGSGTPPGRRTSSSDRAVSVGRDKGGLLPHRHVAAGGQ